MRPFLNPTIGFGCAHNMRSMTAKRSRKRVASVREYIASKPKESRGSLEAVRRAILKAIPNARYVGAGGWVGILLDQIADDALESHLRRGAADHRVQAEARAPAEAAG